MNAIENLPSAARHFVCAVMSFVIVSAALTLGAVGADAEYHSAQRAEVIVEVA